jgi:hypothetical protein
MNLVGTRFSRLTVVEKLPYDRRGHARYRVNCDCGVSKTVLGINLMKHKLSKDLFLKQCKLISRKHM